MIFYVPVSSSQQRTVHVLHNSEQPASVFSILDTGSKTIPVVADTLFDLLVMKMNTVLQKRQKIESRGSRFELCDFCIKIGSVTVPGAGQNFKGVLLEVRIFEIAISKHLCFWWNYKKKRNLRSFIRIPGTDVCSSLLLKDLNIFLFNFIKVNLKCKNNLSSCFTRM